MITFSKRDKAPDKANKFYYSNTNAFYRCGYGMPNCTCYAHGRFAEISGEWLKCYGNAEDWFEEAKKQGYKTGDVPKIGAVICWKCGTLKNGNDGAGHVAIVEEVKPNGDVVTSNSAWGGTVFYMQTFEKSKGYEWRGSSGRKYEFQGFIYNPATEKLSVARKDVKLMKRSDIIAKPVVPLNGLNKKV